MNNIKEIITGLTDEEGIKELEKEGFNIIKVKSQFNPIVEMFAKKVGKAISVIGIKLKNGEA